MIYNEAVLFYMHISRQQFIEDAISLQGIVYQHQGRSKFGADCIGYMALVFEQQDIIAAYPKAYKRVSVVDGIKRYFDAHFHLTDDFVAGNPIIFRKRKVYTHCGILLDDNKMIHCINKRGSKTGGVVISSFDEEKEWLDQDYIVYDLESIRTLK